MFFLKIINQAENAENVQNKKNIFFLPFTLGVIFLSESSSISELLS